MRRSVAEKPATSGLAGSSSILGGLRPPRSMAEGTHKVGFLIALGLGVAISAAGQGRGFSAPTRGSAAPVRGFSAPMRGFSGQVRGMSRPGRTSGFRRGFFFPPVVATPLNPNFEPINGVPGLGFDFPHLAAVSRGFQQPFLFINNGFFPFFAPIFFDPLPLSYPAEIPDYYAEGERQPIFFLIPPPQPQPATPPAEAAPRATTPQSPPPPPPELGQLILVRSDGQVLLAVAFTVRNGQLTYITNQGTRRSFPVSELDKDATRQMNDANGTSVSLPE